MNVDITIPSFGESVSEVTVAQVFKRSGEYVKKDEEIMELESDKVNAPLLSPESGLLDIRVKEQDVLSIGQVIGTVDTSKSPVSSQQPVQPAVQPAKQEIPPVVKEEPISRSTYPKVRITPEEFLASLEKQVEVVASTTAKKVVDQPHAKRKKMSSLRRTIATKLVQVKNETAMLTTFNEVDMSAVMKIRSDEKESFTEKYGVKLGFMSFFVKACVSALKAYPDVNAYIDGDDIVTFSSCDIGVAVSTEKGLMVPVIRNCEEKTFADIEKEIALYSKKARESKLTMNDLKGGSFTITNGGTFGSLLSTPILNPPQSAILGMHAIKERPIAIGKEIVIRPMMYLALSYDHRVIDGKEAVSFLVHVKEHLEATAKLLLDF